MKKLLAALMLFFAIAFALASPLISERKDEVTEACAQRFKAAIDGLMEHPTHYAHETQGGGYPTGPVKAAIYSAYWAEQEMGSSGYNDLFTRNHKFSLFDRGYTDILGDGSRHLSVEEKARVQESQKSANERNLLMLKLRQKMIDAVLSTHYIDGFVDHVVTRAMIRQTDQGTLARVKAFRPYLEQCIKYAEAWSDEVRAAELAWLAQCNTVAAIENQRDVYSADEGHVVASDAEEKNILVRYRFNHYAPGEWNHESDSKPLTERASMRFAETFVFRRFETDGMTKEQVLLILNTVKAKLAKVEAGCIEVGGQ